MIVKTANVGGIDINSNVIDVQINTQSVLDYTNRLSARYYKTHHDNKDVIWLDSSYQIYNKDFVKYVEELLGDNDLMIMNHGQRNTLGEEYDFILKLLKSGDNYLQVRYGQEDWLKEIEAFKDGLDAKLIHSAFFAARTTCNDLMKDWWRLILEYTVFDQSQITYLIHKNTDLKVKLIDWKDLDGYVRYIGHKKIA